MKHLAQVYFTGVIVLVVFAGHGIRAVAGIWRVTPVIGLSESFTDNVDLATDGQDRTADLVTVVSPGVSVRGSGGRLSLDLDYVLERTLHRNRPQRDDFTHDLTAHSRSELYNRILFLDAQASISQQLLDNTAAATGSPANLRPTERRPTPTTSRRCWCTI